MSEFLALDLPELRRRLEAHQATRPTDIFSPEMKPWMKKKDSIAFAIELKEAEAAQKPFYITVPPQPIERPVQPLLRLRKAKEPTHPAPEEAPMPRSNPTHHRSHQARIEHLVERIQAATRKGEKLYWAQQEIRDLCKAHGLEVPVEAQKRERGTTKQDAPPHHLQDAPGQEAAMQPEPKPLVAPKAATCGLVGQLRGMRGQVIALLPQCDGLSPEEARAVEREIDLLADALALGVRLTQAVA